MLALTDSALAPLCHLRHGLPPARRRALELLASCPDGCSEAILRAHGFTTDFLVDLIRAGLATAQTERAVVGRHSMQVTRMRITDAGRRALGELRWP